MLVNLPRHYDYNNIGTTYVLLIPWLTNNPPKNTSGQPLPQIYTTQRDILPQSAVSDWEKPRHEWRYSCKDIPHHQGTYLIQEIRRHKDFADAECQPSELLLRLKELEALCETTNHRFEDRDCGHHANLILQPDIKNLPKMPRQKRGSSKPIALFKKEEPMEVGKEALRPRSVLKLSQNARFVTKEHKFSVQFISVYCRAEKVSQSHAATALATIRYF